MSATTRARLLEVVRRPSGDLAEAALLCGAEADPGLDVAGTLLRVDALTDLVRTRGNVRSEPEAVAEALRAVLAGDLGFSGRNDHDPDNALLHRLLDTRRGLPVTLSALYASVARRLGVGAWCVHLPGHVLTGLAAPDRPILLDPFHGGARLGEADVADLVTRATGDARRFHRALLRPAPAVEVVRRLLNNLTRDYLVADRLNDALWTLELKLLLPNRRDEDHRHLGDLLRRTGRFDRAARAYEAFLATGHGAAEDREAVRRAAVDARARMN